MTEKEERKQRWREKIEETETREAWFREQLIERTQQVLNFQRKLSRKELECTEKEEREENLRTHLEELQQQLREKKIYRDRCVQCSMTICREISRSADLRQQIAILEDKLESQLQDRNICYCSGCGSSFKLLLPKVVYHAKSKFCSNTE